MEYIFGTINQSGVIKEVLKTKDKTPSDLSGKMEVNRKYPDCTITDSFIVDSKYQSKLDEEGNCYDWYYISNHYRYIRPNISEIENKITDTQDALCEATTDIEARLADIENALCEITEEN